MRPAKILLVEDSPYDEALALKALRGVAAVERIDTRRDGAEAIDYLFGEHGCAQNDPPSLVLLDLKLPKLNGIEVVRRMRSEPAGQRIPVVMMTSSIEQRDLQGAYEAGTNSYIRKPVDFTEFTEAVQLLARYWLGLNQVPQPTTDRIPRR